MSYWFESYIPWFRRRVRGFRKPQATRSSLIDCAQRHGLGANPMASANRRPLSLSTAAAADSSPFRYIYPYIARSSPALGERARDLRISPAKSIKIRRGLPPRLHLLVPC